MDEGFGRFSEMSEEAHREDEMRLEHEPEHGNPERRKIKKELTIIVHKNFDLTPAKFRDALKTVQLRHRSHESIETLRQSGYDYGNERIYPTPIYIKANEITGTETSNGWSGLVEEIGETQGFAGRTQGVEQAFKQAKQLIEMKPDERNHTLDGIEFAMQESGAFRSFFVDSDGRHRIFTLKGLAEMGCDVTISGIKVAPLVKK